MECKHLAARKQVAQWAFAAFFMAATVFAACAEVAPAKGRSSHLVALSTAEYAVPFEQHQAACADKDGWNDPAPPIHIFANVYDVGTCGLVVLLLTGPRGDILIDSGTAEAAPDIARNIQRLGIKLTDIKVMLASHEHLDHVGGAAELKRRTGARLMVLPDARYAVESGLMSPDDPQLGLWPAFPPARVDALLSDRQTVSVGPLKLTAHATYGHSRGSTTWTWTSCEGRVCHALVYADSVTAPAAPGYRFSDHPDRVARFRSSLAKIAALRCDILITPHPAVSNFYQRMAGGAPLVNPRGCADYAATASKSLDERLGSEMQK
jgi:metallo-beta-lactamase class B